MSATTPTEELSASCHILPMDEGLYCVSLGEPAVPGAISASLPGVRLSLPPGPQSEHHGVTISTFRADGWLDMDRPAALVHVAKGPARVMLTIYQEPSQPREAAPRLVITQLGQLLPGQPRVVPVAAAMQGTRSASGMAAPGFPPSLAASGMAPSRPSTPTATGYTGHPTVIGQADATHGAAPEGLITAHVRNRGDVQARLTERVGVPGSRIWIEGFGIALPPGWGQGELEYQAVVGKNGATPWLPAPEFCGSRGQTLPLLGLGLRLRGAAARLYDCTYRASFIDGFTTGPVTHGQLCRSPSEAALEAFQVTLSRKML